MNLLVAGVGNSLLQDDGIGVHAVRELAKSPLPGVVIAEVGTDFLGALHLFEAADIVLVLDAMEAGGPPGTIYLHEECDILENSHQVSLHELGVLTVLRFSPSVKRPRVIILGVEPQTIGFGLDLSSALQAALPQIMQAAREIIDQILYGNGEQGAGSREPSML
jgi:hydrogenase maturation protease